MCLFVQSGIQHILCCSFVLFFFVLYTLCCQFLWIVFFIAPSVFSNVYIEGNDNNGSLCFLGFLLLFCYIFIYYTSVLLLLFLRVQIVSVNVFTLMDSGSFYVIITLCCVWTFVSRSSVLWWISFDLEIIFDRLKYTFLWCQKQFYHWLYFCIM